MTKEILIEEALKARENSYSPYSNFKVGAAVLCKDGNVFHGANIENSSYGLCMCAERNALYNAMIFQMYVYITCLVAKLCLTLVQPHGL